MFPYFFWKLKSNRTNLTLYLYIFLQAHQFFSTLKYLLQIFSIFMTIEWWWTNSDNGFVSSPSKYYVSLQYLSIQLKILCISATIESPKDEPPPTKTSSFLFTLRLLPSQFLVAQLKQKKRNEKTSDCHVGLIHILPAKSFNSDSLSWSTLVFCRRPSTGKNDDNHYYYYFQVDVFIGPVSSIRR